VINIATPRIMIAQLRRLARRRDELSSEDLRDVRELQDRLKRHGIDLRPFGLAVGQLGFKPKPRERSGGIAFEMIPPLGTIIVHDGQRYELVRTEPYTRRDGHETTLLVWCSGCAECGAPFEFLTSLRKDGLNRRCDGHKRPGIPVTPRGRAGTRRHFANPKDRRRPVGGVGG
jgi:hypothetical protein